jgi:FMN phosphatase YigB (HAD superfamily)
VCKPDPRIFQAALDQLGISPAQAVFVGHLKTELDGARSVGMGTVAFNQESLAVADHTIQNFAELLELPFVKGTIQHQEKSSR